MPSQVNRSHNIKYIELPTTCTYNTFSGSISTFPNTNRVGTWLRFYIQKKCLTVIYTFLSSNSTTSFSISKSGFSTYEISSIFFISTLLLSFNLVSINIFYHLPHLQYIIHKYWYYCIPTPTFIKMKTQLSILSRYKIFNFSVKPFPTRHTINL